MRNGHRERLTSAREEWESKVKTVETNLSTTAAKFDAGLESFPAAATAASLDVGIGE